MASTTNAARYLGVRGGTASSREINDVAGAVFDSIDLTLELVGVQM